MSRHDKIRIIISGGGTGGHIFPAISIANAIKKLRVDAEILFVGAEGRMEMEKVPAEGYPIIGLPVAGFYRSLTPKNIIVLFKLFRSMLLAKKIIREFKPDVAVGVGGYASGPILRQAAKVGIPALIQEQNSYAGVTNRILAKKASVICVAYDGMEKYFPAEKIIKTGNPVRAAFFSDQNLRDEAAEFFKLDKNMPVVLILGGSLGAGTINRSISENIQGLKEENIQWIWQTGKLYYENVNALVNLECTDKIKVLPFIDRMDYAFAAADVIISRAGAGTISELCLVGKPVILVPSPNVAEDHQTKNAMALSEKDAAILISDKEAVGRLVQEAVRLVNDAGRKTVLSDNIKALAERDSDIRIAEEILKLASG